MGKKILGVCILLFLFSISAFSRDFVIAGIPEEPNRWKD